MSESRDVYHLAAVQNFTEFGQLAAESWPNNDFYNGGCPVIWLSVSTNVLLCTKFHQNLMIFC